GDELEHILKDVSDIRLYRLNVSANAKIRNAVVRIDYRKKRLRGYFDENGVKEHKLSRDEIKLFYKGAQIDIGNQYIREGTLIGLNHKNITMALGIVIKFDPDAVFFKSPIKSLKGINRVVFGNISI
ncbi:hypothetical protein KKH56_08240, partial [bacterium]|nr:hypothetical protein [bacterium]